MKVILLALVAIVALQSATATSVPNKVHPIFYRHGQRWDPVGEVEAAIASLVQTITNAINVAKAEITQALTDVENFYDGLKVATQTELDKLVAEAVANIADTVNVPDEVLQACVDQSEITKIPVALMDDLIGCVTDKINEAVALVDDIVANIDRAIDIITHFDDRLGSCGWSVGCYADLLWDIGSAAIEIPINITSDVAQATALISGLVPALEACALTQITEAGILIAVDVAEIIICAESA